MAPIAVEDLPEVPETYILGLEDHKQKTSRKGSFAHLASNNGNATIQHNDNNGSLSDFDVPLRSQPAYTARRLRVITIGAGFSAMIFAHKLRYVRPEIGSIVDHTIYETRSDCGGTWLVNNYPGVQCDVPAHIYAFPFDPNPHWSHYYATGPEIHEYFTNTVKKWDLDRDVEFNSRVVGAHWQERTSQWKVTVEQEGSRREEFADTVISAQGFLNTWKWPEIPGLDDFTGHKVHSAEWDHSYDYSHKRIAVIGNGSSGIQILPEMAKLPGTQVVSFQRGPTWVISRHDEGGIAGGSNNPAYSAEQQRIFATNPKAHHEYRRSLIQRSNRGFKLFVKGSAENLTGFEAAKAQMATKLDHNPELCEKLIPKWELGCRRVTPGQGYLESFLLPNVSLTQSPIRGITKNSIITADGEERLFDVVVCATGFDVSHRPAYPVIGRGGVSLSEKWKHEPESYMSLACPDMPNYFIFTGPNAVVGHGSLIEGLNWVSDYILKWVDKIAREDIRSVEPRQSAVDQFVRYGDQIHKTLTWTGECRSWYKNNRVDGRVTATFAGSSLLFKRLISEIRGEDWDITYGSANKFAFMGNGFTEYEREENNDLAWYIER